MNDMESVDSFGLLVLCVFAAVVTVTFLTIGTRCFSWLI